MANDIKKRSGHNHLGRSKTRNKQQTENQAQDLIATDSIITPSSTHRVLYPQSLFVTVLLFLFILLINLLSTSFAAAFSSSSSLHALPASLFFIHFFLLYALIFLFVSLFLLILLFNLLSSISAAAFPSSIPHHLIPDIRS